MLLENLDEAYDKPAWHGPNLRNALRGLTPEKAAWRPLAFSQTRQQHNIWEFMLHAAYWKYVVRRRLTREKRGSLSLKGAFPLKGSNFFARPVELTAKAWQSDLAILDAAHRSLREAVAQLTDPDAKQLRLIRGAAAHDLYHAGQIRLLRRLQE